MKEILFAICSFVSICRIDFKTELIKNFSLSSQTKISEVYLHKGNIVRPLSSWVKLAESRRACLFYKIPFKENTGELRLIKSDGSCSFDEELISSMAEISSLSISKRNDKFSTNNLTFQITISTTSERKIYEVPLLKNKITRKGIKYSHNVDLHYFDSVSLFSDIQHALLEDGMSCHAVNSSCTSVTENNCQSCMNGFYEVVDFNCPQGGSKYCGFVRCGEKGSHACPRGYEILDSKLPSLCFDGSPAGYCSPGLKTYCSEDKILVCL